jgi:hypothetical protein
MRKTIDLAGQRFGRLMVMRRGPSAKAGDVRFWCECDCGRACVLVTSSNLRHGHSQSCGCQRNEICAAKCRERTRHGATGTPEHEAWRSSRQRCLNSNHRAFKHYGGRGLQHGFPTFEAFFAELGLRPTKQHTVERIDNRFGYVPGNVEWALPPVQARNRRSNLFLTWQGETLCITDWAFRLGINQQTLSARLARGWSVEATLSTPVRQKSSPSSSRPPQRKSED